MLSNLFSRSYLRSPKLNISRLNINDTFNIDVLVRKFVFQPALIEFLYP